MDYIFHDQLTESCISLILHPRVSAWAESCWDRICGHLVRQHLSLSGLAPNVDCPAKSCSPPFAQASVQEKLVPGILYHPFKPCFEIVPRDCAALNNGPSMRLDHVQLKRL